MDTIAITAFGLDIDSQKNAADPFVQHAKRVFSFQLISPLLIIAGMSYVMTCVVSNFIYVFK